MRSKINEILAKNLAYEMDRRLLTQSGLSKLSGVAQTTISLYLNPKRREPSKSGKSPSANLSDVQAVAEALGMDAWELLVPSRKRAKK